VKTSIETSKAICALEVSSVYGTVEEHFLRRNRSLFEPGNLCTASAELLQLSLNNDKMSFLLNMDCRKLGVCEFNELRVPWTTKRARRQFPKSQFSQGKRPS
jgi:hypothetical protein